MIGWLRRLLKQPEHDDPLVGVKRTADQALKLPIDDSPVDALGLELRLAADQLTSVRISRIRRSRYLRRVGVLVATGASFVAIAAGGTRALGVEVPSLDMSSKTYLDRGRHENTSPPRYGPPKSFADIAHQPLNSSDVIKVRIGRSPEEAIGIAYTGATGRVCFAWAKRNQSGELGELNSNICIPLSIILNGILNNRGIAFALSAGAYMMVTGVVSDEIDSLAVRGPYGKLDTAISNAWTPDIQDIPHFRSFFAVYKLDMPIKQMNRVEKRRVQYVTNYKIVGRLDSGRQARIPL